MGDRCAAGSGAEPASLCLEFPDAGGDPLGAGFQSASGVRRFCAPLCRSDGDCADLDARFVCQTPEWRGNPLFSGQLERVCGGDPDTSGPSVDPITCDWTQAALSVEAREVCEDYCSYLLACRELPAELTEACCGWSCYGTMTAGAGVDAAYRRQVDCYAKTFQAYQPTTLVCTAPRDDCGGAPPIPPVPQ